MQSVKSFLSEMDLPDIYFEFTSDDFCVAPRRIIEHGKELCDLWETKRMFRISGCQAGCYLAYNLHKTPHYQRPYNMRSKIDNEAKKKGLTIEKVDMDTFEEKGFLYHYNENSSIYKEYVHPRINEFQLNHVIEMLDKLSLCSRGNVAKSIGWRALDYKFDIEEKIHIPTRYPVSAYDRTIFKLMTSLVKDIFSDKIHPQPFSGNDVRREKFSDSLLQVDTEVGEEGGTNCFESITYAMSYVEKKDHLLVPHIDQFNCKEEGYNMVFSVYFHAKHPTKDNTIVRIVFIGYTRRQMHEYFQRLSLRNVFKKNLMKYASFLGVRNRLKIENAFPYTKKGTPTFYYSIPFTDKCAFYSLFVSAIYDLTKVFHDGTKPLSSNDILELALPIVWLPTGYYYYQVLKEWERNQKLPQKNLTMAVVEYIVEQSGGLSKGYGQRFMPFCNKAIPKNKVIDSLRNLRNILLESKSSNWSSNDLLQGIKGAVFCCGDIGAQHLMSVLTLLKVIEDTKFVRDTVVLKNTRTEKRVKKLYKMSHQVINELYKEVANEIYDGNLRLVENLTCEYFRDMGTKVLYDVLKEDYDRSINKRIGSTIRHPDVFHSTQALFIEEDFVVYRYFYNSEGVVEKENVSIYFISKDDKGWISSSTPLYPEAEVLQVKKAVSTDISTTSSRKKKRQKVTHDIIDDDVSADEEISNDRYSSRMHRQVSIQWKKSKGRGFIPSDKFVWKDSWYDGYYKKIQVEHIVKMVTNPSKKKKTRKTKIIHIRNAITLDGKEVFTATIKTDKKEITLSSTIEHLPTYGYYGSLKTTFSNREDIVAYYETKASAKKAMLVYILALSDYDLATNSFFRSYKGKKNQAVALFETVGKGKQNSVTNFVMLLWSDDEAKFRLEIPNANDLFNPWISYPINF